MKRRPKYREDRPKGGRKEKGLKENLMKRRPRQREDKPKGGRKEKGLKENLMKRSLFSNT
ncbi:hypothetical protein RhiirC2_757438 [Rhizophagus irregularis]|uniref:Uncharacterized protein n=1 Tax=Rhizophagus irregularis TaxID=588596 RepID=A0A2N1MQU2_9GLOM|nr:hypothetical protein RhiirC2_757438 [Rhizophagus irregularis]